MSDRARPEKPPQPSSETIAKRKAMFAEWFERVRELLEEG